MDSYEWILEELKRALYSVEKEERVQLKQKLLQAKRVYIAGMGRSGLIAGCFAMRLAQVGLQAMLVGETTVTAIQPGDLLLILSGSGNTKTLVQYESKAIKAGAEVVLLTVDTKGEIAQNSNLVVTIPAAVAKFSTDSESFSVQPMGSLFEQSVLLLLDIIVMELMKSLGETNETMKARHANLE